MNELISTENMSKEEWLHWRSKGIGGSDASIICGINKYKTPVELWMEKIGMVESKGAGEAAYWGTLVDPLIREEFSKRTGLEVRIEKSMLQHPKCPFMLANVDGIIMHPDYGGCIFEAKTSSVFRSDEWEDSIPEEYQIQVQHYMAVTDFKGTFVAVLIGGNQFKWQFIPRDDELISMLIKLEKQFWKYVETKTPPPLDGSKASGDFLNRLYTKSNPQSIIQLPEEALQYISQYEEFQEKENEVVFKKDEAANKLKQILGENECGTINDRTVTWKTLVSERLDTKSLKAEHPRIHEKYVCKSSYRRFGIK